MTPVQCRMGRAALRIDVRQLAELSQVSPNTIARLERGEALQPRTLAFIQGALEAAGVRFTHQGGVIPTKASSQYKRLFSLLLDSPDPITEPGKSYEHTVAIFDQWLDIIEAEGREPTNWERRFLARTLGLLARSDTANALALLDVAIAPPDDQCPSWSMPRDEVKELAQIGKRDLRAYSKKLKARGYLDPFRPPTTSVAPEPAPETSSGQSPSSKGKRKGGSKRRTRRRPL